MRPAVWPDPLYGSIRLAGWAAALLSTPPFARLAAVSLSDVPGDLLFGHAFPSRLDHVRGVYHLARVSRPRDRALQAAALAHDLGHGPFSHLSEPLMRDWLGCDHEERASRQLAVVLASLPTTVRQRLSWLDWDEVAGLVVGNGFGGRGALLNSRLDYDNTDNIARFIQASGLGEPGYEPEALARALRLVPPATHGERAIVDWRGEPTYLLAHGQDEALAWQAARARVYGFLDGSHSNLAPHAMLRKAIDLARASQALPATFLDLTDAQALAALAESAERGAAALAHRVREGAAQRHICIWEAEVPVRAKRTLAILDEWREHLSLEAKLAGEAGLAPHDVILEALTSAAARALPPLAPTGRPATVTWLPLPEPSPHVVHLFVTPDTPLDYRRRLRAAAERRLGALGAVPRSALS